MSFCKPIGLVCLLMIVGASSASAQATATQSTKTFWIFLTTGKGVEGVSGDDIQKMQTAHLTNFRKLASEGKLLTAGPMNDPKGKLRGIVVVKATDAAAVKKMFEADPYVTNGFMNVESREADITCGKFASKITPSEMEELRIVVFNRPESGTSSPEILKGQGDYTQGLFNDGSLLFATRLSGEGSRQYVWITPPRSNLISLVESAPIVKSAGFKHQIIPLYMGKGAIEAKPEPKTP